MNATELRSALDGVAKKEPALAQVLEAIIRNQGSPVAPPDPFTLGMEDFDTVPEGVPTQAELLSLVTRNFVKIESPQRRRRALKEMGDDHKRLTKEGK